MRAAENRLADSANIGGFSQMVSLEKECFAPQRSYARYALCLLTLSSASGLAQTYSWTPINPPKINYLSSISVQPSSIQPSDVSRMFLSAEHDGNWSNASATAPLVWTFGSPSPPLLPRRRILARSLDTVLGRPGGSFAPLHVGTARRSVLLPRWW